MRESVINMNNNGKIAIVTGAFGFAGANLTEHLLDYGYKVYAVGRKGSSHNDRFAESESLRSVNISTTVIFAVRRLLLFFICHGEGRGMILTLRGEI